MRTFCSNTKLRNSDTVTGAAATSRGGTSSGPSCPSSQSHTKPRSAAGSTPSVTCSQHSGSGGSSGEGACLGWLMAAGLTALPACSAAAAQPSLLSTHPTRLAPAPRG
jgi:hypothetical protein